MPRKKAVEEIYQKKSPREHVLLRPDTYVGSIERDTEKMFVMNEETGMMEERDIEYVPALYKIFDEILVNAADNKQRDPSMKEIRVKIDIDNGYICIRNDGKGIPVEIHSEHKMYVPELIFGNLLTSSNYNDADLKTVGGRNGFGAKLANIFSKKFVVETVDSENGKKYKQKWTNNMSVKGEPDIVDITNVRRIKDYTKVTFYPDFARFGMTSFANEDILKLFVKRVYDIAGTTSSDLKVYLNNEQIQTKNFIDYCKLFIGKKVKSKTDYFHFKDDANKWEVIFCISTDGEYRQVSHVNNIWTIKGGSHVKYIENQFINYFKKNFKAKQKKLKEMLKPKMIRDHLWVFINSLVVNPAFSSQTKESLTTKSSAFGSKCTVSEDIKKRLMNKIKALVKEFLNYKLDQDAKKTDGGRRKKIQFPAEIEDANDAGKKYSADCTLIVTEGLSAKTLAVAGISELDGSNNRYGIFPLKGKLLNVREAPRGQINKNAEITHLKQILGLKHCEKYVTRKSAKTLRYGKVMIMTDQDYDGSHIKGLMINLFHSEWPGLIQKKLFGKDGNESFVEQFITPIVVASKGTTIKKAFYTVPEYEKWKKQNNNGKGWKVKYYKGLGSWQRKDGKEHFKRLDKHRIAFDYTDKNDLNMETGNECGNENDNAITKAFAKDQADNRKSWINAYEEGTHIQYNRRVSYKTFIDKELILFSVNDLHRSIPSICDGLKPGQRKILYCCFLKNNLKKEIRVAQLGGYVSEKSAYHHGEASLYQTIIGMAQDYVGSNNINLLVPNGMFGSRIKGGKDAASPRYIHTMLSPITRRLFHSNDDMILDYIDDDGYPVEPKHYIPIIPLVLVNGCKGIGTGWSTNIPNYNPQDIIKNIRRKLSGEEFASMDPFYRGFSGDIVISIADMNKAKKKSKKNSNNNSAADSNVIVPSSLSYKTKGKIEIIDTFERDGKEYSSVQISELPVQTWTENYKKYLMDLEEAEQIENMNNMSSDIDISFTFDIMHKVRPVKGGRSSNTNTNSNSNSPSRAGEENKKKFKKKLYFSGEFDDQFIKDMKLQSSLSCTNMVLFDVNGKIHKYGKVEEILQEFYDGRLKAYAARKKAMLKALEHELQKVTNQARFIMMIIDEELVLSRRKKFDILCDLKKHKFDLWEASDNHSNTLRNRAKQTDAFEEENEQNSEEKKENSMDIDSGNDERSELLILSRGYKYLLSMSLSSLTEERVHKLMETQENTEEKVKQLRKKSVKDLWRIDLDELDGYLQEYDSKYEHSIEEMRKDAQIKREKLEQSGTKGKGKKGVRKGKAKKTATRKRTTKKKLKKESSVSSTTTTSSMNKSMKKLNTKVRKVTKNTQSKKKGKKKLLSTSNKLPSDPFSIAKAQKKKKSKNKFVDSEDSEFEDSEQSPTAHLSLFERVNKKRNTPQKSKSINSRKRKRNDNDFDEFDMSDHDTDMDIEPPKKRTKNANKSASMSPSKSLSHSSNGTLESITNKNRNVAKPKIMNLDTSDESDSDSFDQESKTNYKNTNTKKKKSQNSVMSEEEDFDIDDEDEYSENNRGKNRRVLRKKNKKSYKEASYSESNGNNSDSEFNMDSELEIDEDDESSEYTP